MMKNTVRIACITLCTLVLLSPFDCRIGASERVIERIRFETISLAEERVFFKLGAYGPPTVFGLEGERRRLVCDFFDTAIGRDVPRVIQTEGNLVLRIRVGVHIAPKQKTRVVLDLAPREEDYSVQQHLFEDTVLVITVRLKEDPRIE